MKILILHRIPYGKIDYHRGIDHRIHQVFYFGRDDNLSTIPTELPCQKILRTDQARAIEQIVNYTERHNIVFDCVVSLSEYELELAASIRQTLRIDGPTPASVEKVRNKLIMKECVAQRGLRTPRNLSLNDFMSIEDEQHYSFSGKCVLKPVDGASSENVFIFNSIEKMRFFVADGQTPVKSLNDGQYGGFEVEEFIEGPILHFDGVIYEGKILALTASEYIGTCVDYANGSPLASIQIAVNDEIYCFAELSLQAVELLNGAFHIEAFQTAEGLVFLELANRVGGADVVKTFELATGIHMPSEELKIYTQTNQYQCATPSYSHKKYGWFVFPGHTLGTELCLIEGFEALKEHACLLNGQTLSPSIPVKKHITYQAHEVPVAGVLQGTTEAMQGYIKTLFSTVQVLPFKILDVANA